MSNYEKVYQNFKVGVLIELHKRNLITREELEIAIKSIKTQ